MILYLIELWYKVNVNYELVLSSTDLLDARNTVLLILICDEDT